MNNLSEILNLLQQHKKHIKQYGISRIGVFGSVVRGEATDTSDIDLLVEFFPGQKNYRNFFASSQYLEKILKKPVDLVTPQALSSYIKPHIDQEVSYVQID